MGRNLLLECVWLRVGLAPGRRRVVYPQNLEGVSRRVLSDGTMHSVSKHQRALMADLTVAGRGSFSVRDAAEHGVTLRELHAARSSGELVRVTRGFYAWRTRALSAEDAHRVLVRALVRRYGGRAVASHHSALAMYRLPIYAADLSHVHLTFTAANSHRRCADHTVHRPVRGADQQPTPPQALVMPDGVVPVGDVTPWVMPPAVSIVQAGLLNGPRAALVAADSALARGDLTWDDLALAVAAFPRAAGRRMIERALAMADSRAESPPESVLRYDLRLLGYDVVPQFWVRTRAGHYRADLHLRGTRLLIEYDGRGKYLDPEEEARERRRRRDLEADGWRLVRFTAEHLGNLHVIGQIMQAAIKAMPMAG